MEERSRNRRKLGERQGAAVRDYAKLVEAEVLAINNLGTEYRSLGVWRVGGSGEE